MHHASQQRPQYHPRDGRSDESPQIRRQCLGEEGEEDGLPKGRETAGKNAARRAHMGAAEATGSAEADARVMRSGAAGSLGVEADARVMRAGAAGSSRVEAKGKVVRGRDEPSFSLEGWILNGPPACSRAGIRIDGSPLLQRRWAGVRAEEEAACVRRRQRQMFLESVNELFLFPSSSYLIRKYQIMCLS